MTVLALQRRLKSLGYDIATDGLIGPQTLAAANAALDKLPGAPVSEKPIQTSDTSPVWSQPKTKRPISGIIIHCTATPEGRETSVKEIDRWHRERGFSGIGYHYVVHLDGTVEAGRPEIRVGAHVSGHNEGTLGVVYVGGLAKNGTLAKDTRTPAQKAALEETVKALVSKYPTIKKVTGHNQYAAKACPSFDVRKDPLSKLV